MRLTDSQVKKILCDDAVVAMATRCGDLTRDGQFTEKQLAALVRLDDFYVKTALRIASGDAKAIAQEFPCDTAD